MKKIIIFLIFLPIIYLSLSFSQNKVLLLGSYTKFNYFVDVKNKTISYITDNQWKADNLIDVRFFIFTLYKSHYSKIFRYDKLKNVTEQVGIDHKNRNYIKKLHQGNKLLELWNSYNNDPDKNSNPKEKKEDNNQKSNSQQNQQISINYKPSSVDISSKRFPAIELEVLYNTNNQQFKASVIFISSKDLRKFLEENNLSSKDISYFEKYINKYKLDFSVEDIPIKNIPDNVDKGIKDLLKPILKQGRDILHSIKLLRDNKMIAHAVFIDEIRVLPYNPQDFQIPPGYVEKQTK